MAPSAMVNEIAPMQLPVNPKGSPINASVLHGPGDLRLEVRSIEEPGIGEVQVAVKSTGICGSDVSYYKKFANGDLCACAPLSLGHESSGVVVGIGSQVSGFRIGDRVALEVGVPCAQCSICRKGRYNLCKKMRFRSSAKSVPHYQGTLQERINHPAVWCHKLPDHVSFEAAALLEPLSVAIHAVNRACPAPGSTALVMGAGTVGLLTAAMARQSGCTDVTIADVDAGRVDYALKHGFATHGYVVSRPLHPSPSSSSIYTSHSGASTPPEEAAGTTAATSTSAPAAASTGYITPPSEYSRSSNTSSGPGTGDAVQQQLAAAKALAADMLALARREQVSTASSRAPHDNDNDGGEDDGVDVAFECTGKESCTQTCLYAARPGGKLVMVGMGTPIQTMPLSAAHLREVDILGIFRYAGTYPTGIRLLCAQGLVAQRQKQQGQGQGGFSLPSLDAMVTHRFKGLDAAKGAFELASRTVDDAGNLVLKVIIEA